MEKINILLKVYNDDLTDLKRKNKTVKTQREIELTEQFIIDLEEILEIHTNIVRTLIGGTMGGQL